MTPRSRRRSFHPRPTRRRSSSFARESTTRRSPRCEQAVASDALVTDRALQSDDVKPGVAALRQKNVGAAIAALETAVKRHAESSEVHRILGMAYAGAKQYDRALTELRTASRLNPRDERSRLATSDVLVASGDLAAAAGDPSRYGAGPSTIGRGVLAAREARSGTWRRRRRAIVRAGRGEATRRWVGAPLRDRGPGTSRTVQCRRRSATPTGSACADRAQRSRRTLRSRRGLSRAGQARRSAGGVSRCGAARPDQCEDVRHDRSGRSRSRPRRRSGRDAATSGRRSMPHCSTRAMRSAARCFASGGPRRRSRSCASFEPLRPRRWTSERRQFRDNQQKIDDVLKAR